MNQDRSRFIPGVSRRVKDELKSACGEAVTIRRTVTASPVDIDSVDNGVVTAARVHDEPIACNSHDLRVLSAHVLVVPADIGVAALRSAHEIPVIGWQPSADLPTIPRRAIVHPRKQIDDKIPHSSKRIRSQPVGNEGPVDRLI